MKYKPPPPPLYPKGVESAKEENGGGIRFPQIVVSGVVCNREASRTTDGEWLDFEPSHDLTRRAPSRDPDRGAPPKRNGRGALPLRARGSCDVSSGDQLLPTVSTGSLRAEA